jgi:hypothetical protein
MKRRVRSYDLSAIPDDGYVVTDDEGEIYADRHMVEEHAVVAVEGPNQTIS